LNKSYDQHPIAKIILGAARDRRPEHVAMWGVGLTDSDADLLELYAAWVKRAGSLDVINPQIEVAEKAEQIFRNLCGISRVSQNGLPTRTPGQ
jgi:hypothetical protein